MKNVNLSNRPHYRLGMQIRSQLNGQIDDAIYRHIESQSSDQLGSVDRGLMNG